MLLLFSTGVVARVERLTDYGTKCSNRSVRQEDERHDHRPVLVGYKLSHCNVKAELNCFSQTIHGATNDERVYISGRGTNDDAEESNAIAPDEEPSSSEKIRQPSKNCVCEREGKSPSNVDPRDVVTWSNVRVDVRENVCGKYEKEIRADGGQTESLCLLVLWAESDSNFDVQSWLPGS